ncbi:MAG TPA: sialic acid TRAP transporter substrate-binding protein SiaP [Desulfopila sp.]|nr:sialic acid TRAP transporter substrate-binding protein SiaP [Desulfopila sp.]
MMTKKRRFTHLAVVAIATVTLAFCGNLINVSDATAKKIKIRIGTVVNGDHPENVGARKIKELIEAKAGDRVDVQVFTSSQLGNQRTMVENLRNGVLEITWVTTGFFGSYEPILNVLECGYLFRDSEHSYKVFDGPIGEEVKSLVDKHGVKVLGFFEAGMRHVTTTDKAIYGPADLDGLKIRTPKAKYHLNTLKYMGANPVPMAFSELYTAMQTGVVDGQENPVSNIYNAKFYEVNKYIALTGHLHLTHMVMYSEKLWNKLPADIQAIVKEAVIEAQAVQRAAVRKDDATLLAELKANGMEVTEPDRAAFRESVLPLREEAVQEFGPKAQDMIDRIEATK